MGCQEALERPRPEAPTSKPVVLVVAAALIDADNRVLLAQRPAGKAMAGLWEFPGGKVDSGEVPEFALMRELGEELGIETRPTCFSPVSFASHTYDSFHLLMPLYACRFWSGEPEAREHEALAWVRPEDMGAYDMPAADIPLIAALRDYL